MGLKELNWNDAVGDNGVIDSDGNYITDAASVAHSPLNDYVIKKVKDGYIVFYGGRHPDSTFKTVEAAKDWAENTHYKDKMQQWLEPDLISEYFNKFTQWSTDRQIIQNGNTLAQGLKLVSEIGELADNLAKGRCVADDVGDCMVVLNNLIHMTGLTLEQCLAQTWGDIKDRKGYMNEHGVFIKEADHGKD